MKKANLAAISPQRREGAKETQRSAESTAKSFCDVRTFAVDRFAFLCGMFFAPLRLCGEEFYCGFDRMDF
jgi:hypothetical protein